MRGEIISVLKCPKKTFVVVSSRLNCSTELEVHDQTGERFFINPHSRLVQKTKNHAVCQTVGLGNVWKVQNAIGDFVYITQNKNVQIFPGNVKSLHGTNIFLADENIVFQILVSLGWDYTMTSISKQEISTFLSQPPTKLCSLASQCSLAMEKNRKKIFLAETSIFWTWSIMMSFLG